jgi:hypothetical protein
MLAVQRPMSKLPHHMLFGCTFLPIHETAVVLCWRNRCKGFTDTFAQTLSIPQTPYTGYPHPRLLRRVRRY